MVPGMLAKMRSGRDCPWGLRCRFARVQPFRKQQQGSVEGSSHEIPAQQTVGHPYSTYLVNAANEDRFHGSAQFLKKKKDVRHILLALSRLCTCTIFVVLRVGAMREQNAS